jgi:hypothetical protein
LRIANLYPHDQPHPEGEVAIKIWNIWLGPVSPEVQEKHQAGTSISLDDAEEMFANPVVLDSPMVRASRGGAWPRGQTVVIADVRLFQMINNDQQCESPPLPILTFGRLGTLAL